MFRKFVRSALSSKVLYGAIPLISVPLIKNQKINVYSDSTDKCNSTNPFTYKRLSEYSPSEVSNDDALDYALQQAVIKGDNNAIELLLASGANIHADCDNAVLLAVWHDTSKTLKLLIEKGANIHAQNGAALHYASCWGKIEAVKALVAAGANIHAQNDEALRCAATYNKIEVVSFLSETNTKVSKT